MRWELSIILLMQLVSQGCTERVDTNGRHGKPAVSRDYGYVIGDIVPMDYRFDLKGDHIDPTSLPPRAAVNEWLTIRDYHIEIIPHREGDETHLHVDYQLFKGIKESELLTVPPLSFRLRSHPETSVTTDAWTFTQVPVIPPDQSNETIEPHEGIGVTLIDVHPASQLLAYWFFGVFTVGLLMGLRKYLLQRKSRPFQSTYTKIRSALRDGNDLAVIMEGLRLMHRNFDQTFGQTLFRRDIASFMNTHPAFKSGEEDLGVFFNISARMFFDPVPSAPDSEELSRLVRLLGICVRAEKAAL